VRQRAALARLVWVAVLAAAVSPVGTGPAIPARADDPAAEVTEALRQLGPPAFLWGRLAVEEESPDGPWTPLGGVDVDVYPAVPSLLAELEAIRRSARASGAEYESAVARLQAALAVHRTRVETLIQGGAPRSSGPRGRVVVSREGDGFHGEPAASPSPTEAGAPGAGESSAAVTRPKGGEPRRQTTDPAGLFVFDGLPAGDWLVVAIRIIPIGQNRTAPKALSPSRSKNFLPSTTGPTKEAEVWLATVHLAPGGRTPLVLTDRARYMVGPVR